MMDIDYALNGRISRQYHEEMIREAQHSQLVAEARKYQKSLLANHSTEAKNPGHAKTLSTFQQVKRVRIAITNVLVR